MSELFENDEYFDDWQEPEEYDPAITMIRPPDHGNSGGGGDVTPAAEDEFGSVSGSARKRPLLLSTGRHQVHHLPEYVSDALRVLSHTAEMPLRNAVMPWENTEHWKRFLVFAIAFNRIFVRLLLPPFLLVPVVAISWIVGMGILALNALIGILPAVLYLIASARNRSSQLKSNTLLFVSANRADQFDAHNMAYKADSGEGDEQEEEGPVVHSKPQHVKQTRRLRSVPAHLYRVPIVGIHISATLWGIVLPMMFEVISFTLLVVSIWAIVTNDLFTGWLWFLNLHSIASTFGTRAVPLLIGIVHCCLGSWVRPFDVIRALELNDRKCVYDGTSIVLHNVCLEQIVRTNFLEERGAVDVNQWEIGGSVMKRPVILVDQITDISIAVSLETLHSRPINFPWLMIRSVAVKTSRNAEHTVLLPVQLPQPSARSLGIRIAQFFIGPMHRTIHSILGKGDEVLRIHDGLSVDETVELLHLAISPYRHDLHDNIQRVIRALQSVQDGGFIL